MAMHMCSPETAAKLVETLARNQCLKMIVAISKWPSGKPGRAQRLLRESPEPAYRFKRRIGPEMIQFILDNRGLTVQEIVDKALIEHGHRLGFATVYSVWKRGE